ncbi:MAG: histidine phosphatase family protein [Alphaproteobacteria bacterium]
MSESMRFFMMRHSYDDDSYIDGKNDTDLTQEGVQIAKKAAINISSKLGDLNSVIDLRSGPKKRTIQTLEILAQQLYADKIPYTITRDNNLVELFQGNMALNGLTHYEKVAGLHYAWVAFNQERNAGNFNYHFGQPHPEMRSNFIIPPYGETQNEFLLRMAKAFLSVLEQYCNKKSVPFVISHRGGIREFTNISNALNKNIEFSKSKVCDISLLDFCAQREIEIKDTKNALDKMRTHVQSLITSVEQR